MPHFRLSPKGFPVDTVLTSNMPYSLFCHSSPFHFCPLSPRHPTMAAGVPGALGVHVPGLAEAGSSSPNVCATTHRQGTMGATARARELSIGPATSLHARHQVSGHEYDLMSIRYVKYSVQHFKPPFLEHFSR